MGERLEDLDACSAAEPDRHEHEVGPGQLGVDVGDLADDGYAGAVPQSGDGRRGHPYQSDQSVGNQPVIVGRMSSMR